MLSQPTREVVGNADVASNSFSALPRNVGMLTKLVAVGNVIQAVKCPHLFQKGRASGKTDVLLRVA